MITEYSALIIAAAFAVIVIVFALVLLFSRRSAPHISREQKKTFACGEDVCRKETLNVPAEAFYSNIIKSLRLDVLRRWHSGNLTSYIITILTGMMLMTLYLIYVW